MTSAIIDFDIGRDAFGHMQIREGVWMGVPVRVARVSFTGELQYEVSVQARHAESVTASVRGPNPLACSRASAR